MVNLAMKYEAGGSTMSRCPSCKRSNVSGGITYQTITSSGKIIKVCVLCVITFIKGSDGLGIRKNGELVWTPTERALEILDAEDFFTQRNKFIAGEVPLSKVLATVTLDYPDLDDVVWKASEKKLTEKIASYLAFNVGFLEVSILVVLITILLNIIGVF